MARTHTGGHDSAEEIIAGLGGDSDGEEEEGIIFTEVSGCIPSSLPRSLWQPEMAAVFNTF